MQGFGEGYKWHLPAFFCVFLALIGWLFYNRERAMRIDSKAFVAAKRVCDEMRQRGSLPRLMQMHAFYRCKSRGWQVDCAVYEQVGDSSSPDKQYRLMVQTRLLSSRGAFGGNEVYVAYISGSAKKLFLSEMSQRLSSLPAKLVLPGEGSAPEAEEPNCRAE